MQALYLLISLVVLILDQALKAYIASNFVVGAVKPFLPGILSLTFLKNNGAAWNILEGQMWFFYLISVVAIAAVLYYLLVNKNYTKAVFRTGLALILGGILGNLFDRLRLHYVIDMIQLDFIHFNIFNLADSAITVGVILVLAYILFDEESKEHDE